MFTVASASALFSSFGTNIGGLLYTAVAVVLVALASLIGLGFAIRKVKSKVTGKKF